MVKIASLIFSIVGTSLAGIVITAMLAIPGLVDGKPILLVAAACGGFIVAAPVSLLIAKAMLKQGLIKK